MLTQLHQYEPLKWASSLKNIPQHFVKVRYENALSIALEVSFLQHEFWISYRILKFLPKGIFKGIFFTAIKGIPLK